MNEENLLLMPLCDNIFMSSPFGLIIFDNRGKLVKNNPAFARIFGASPDTESNFTSSAFLKHLWFYDQVTTIQPGEILQFSDIWLQTEHIFDTSTPKNICVSCLVFGVFHQQILKYLVLEIIDRTDHMVDEELMPN